MSRPGENPTALGQCDQPLSGAGHECAGHTGEPGTGRPRHRDGARRSWCGPPKGANGHCPAGAAGRSGLPHRRPGTWHSARVYRQITGPLTRPPAPPPSPAPPRVRASVPPRILPSGPPWPPAFAGPVSSPTAAPWSTPRRPRSAPPRRAGSAGSTPARAPRPARTAGSRCPPAGRAGTGSPCRAPACPRPRSARPADAAAPGLPRPLPDVRERRVDRQVGGVGLGRQGERDRRLGEDDPRLREADQRHRLGRRHRRRQRRRIGQSDVLARRDHQPPGDEARVLPRLDHPGQVVQGGVHVAAADRLDQRAGHVVVLVAVPVVADGRLVDGGLGTGQGDLRLPLLQRRPGRRLQRGERLAGVAMRPAGPGGPRPPRSAPPRPRGRARPRPRGAAAPGRRRRSATPG